MMPGVVAGFPKRPGIILWSQYGDGFSKDAYGSLTPAFANVNPSATPASGASGEILEFLWFAADPLDPSYPNRAVLKINGSFTSSSVVPFTTLNIDGALLLSKSSATFQSFGSYCTLTWANVSNPFATGNHSLVFA